MQTIVKRLGGISISFICAFTFTTSARADIQLQEDFSGTNVWNAPAPIIDGGSQIDAEIINSAIQLSQDLENAYAACDRSLDCQEINSLIEKVNDFLNNLTDSQAEQLRRSGNLRIW